ncbi:MAG: hypothetical protein Q8P59_05970 [Dehalococcoidia bacterium]|nr:hypothetical protein [Dehalococcoidia bacterium]
MRWIIVIALLAAFVVAAPVASAATPPNFGVMNPGQPDCPWPTYLDPIMQAAGVGKCLPQNIPWTAPLEPGSGIRIVTDQLLGKDGASGWVNFFCESKVGFKFIIGVSGLAPNTSYPITATGLGTIATINTDSRGRGEVGGVVPLAPGFYDLSISVGSVLQSGPSDPQGIAVLP